MAANTNFALSIVSMTVLSKLEWNVSSDLIAKGIGTNPVIVRKIISKLVKAWLVKSYSWKNWGFRLNKPAQDINLLDILNALEEKKFFSGCDKQVQTSCPIMLGMRTIIPELFENIKQTVDKELKDTTLADISKKVSD